MQRGRDSSVGIATRYVLDGPGIEYRWGAKFSAPVQTGPGAHPASYTMDTGSFQGVKRPGRGVDHPPPFNAEVEGRVELYIYSPTGPSWPILGRTFSAKNKNLKYGRVFQKHCIFFILFLFWLRRFSYFAAVSAHTLTFWIRNVIRCI